MIVPISHCQDLEYWLFLVARRYLSNEAFSGAHHSDAYGCDQRVTQGCSAST